MSEPETREVLIDYTNWRGERSKRRISPVEIYFGANEWHPTPQWLLLAMDNDKGEMRTFALEGVHSWSAPPATDPKNLAPC